MPIIVLLFGALRSAVFWAGVIVFCLAIIVTCVGCDWLNTTVDIPAGNADYDVLLEAQGAEVATTEAETDPLQPLLDSLESGQ